MHLMCPECGEKTLQLTQYHSTGGTWTRLRQRAVFSCSVCGYEETL